MTDLLAIPWPATGIGAAAGFVVGIIVGRLSVRPNHNHRSG